MDTSSRILLSLYREARSRPTAEFQKFAIRLIQPSIRFESAVWTGGYLNEDHQHPLLVPIPELTFTHETNPDGVAEWKAINRADKTIPIVFANPFATQRIHTPTLFAHADEQPMRDYARRFGRQSALITALSKNGSFQYNMAVQAGRTYYIDPAVATGYVYATGAGEPDFASVMLPGVQSGPFYISFLDGGSLVTDQILAGALFDFPAGGVNRFTVTGIDPADGLDPNDTTAFVTAITFVGSGTFTGTQTPIVAVTNIPEPGTNGLVASGLIALGFRHRKRALRD